MKPVKSVDEYISGVPEAMQGRLKELRALIVDAAPGAEERMSYDMPFYYYKGRLVYFKLWKNHIGLYALGAEVLKEYKKEIKKYFAEKGTLRFPLDEKLPTELLKKLVKAQVKKNEEAQKKK